MHDRPEDDTRAMLHCIFQPDGFHFAVACLWIAKLFGFRPSMTVEIASGLGG